MLLPQGATVAVVDGAKLNLFHNIGHEAPKLTALPAPEIKGEGKKSGARHQSSSGNPDESQVEEDSFSVGVAQFLNQQVLEGKISDLVIIAAPRTLGGFRKHYHKALSVKLIAEIAKDLTGHTVHDIESDARGLRLLAGAPGLGPRRCRSSHARPLRQTLVHRIVTAEVADWSPSCPGPRKPKRRLRSTDRIRHRCRSATTYSRSVA